MVRETLRALRSLVGWQVVLRNNGTQELKLKIETLKRPRCIHVKIVVRCTSYTASLLKVEFGVEVDWAVNRRYGNLWSGIDSNTSARQRSNTIVLRCN